MVTWLDRPARYSTGATDSNVWAVRHWLGTPTRQLRAVACWRRRWWCWRWRWGWRRMWRRWRRRPWRWRWWKRSQTRLESPTVVTNSHAEHSRLVRRLVAIREVKSILPVVAHQRLCRRELADRRVRATLLKSDISNTNRIFRAETLRRLNQCVVVGGYIKAGPMFAVPGRPYRQWRTTPRDKHHSVVLQCNCTRPG